MEISLTFNRAARLLAFSFPLILQSLSAFEGCESFEEYRGIQSKIEHLGSKLTRDIHKDAEELLAVELKVPGLTEKEYPSLISRSQSYNPATEFFRAGLNVEVTSVSRVGHTTLTPPDTNGAIGPKQYIYALNQEIRSFDRDTGLPDGVINCRPGSFFGTISNAGDPHILYDHLSKAWYVTAMGRSDAGVGGTNIVFAVCKDCVITDCSQWDFYRIPGEFLAPGYTVPRVDYPLMSFDAQAVYVNINVLEPTGTVFLGASIVVFQKTTLFKGDPLVTIFPLVNINPTDSSDVPIFYSPAINFDKDPKYAYFIHRSLSFASDVYTNLHMIRIVNPGSDQPTLAAPVSIPVPPYSTFAGFFAAPHPGNPFPVGNGIDPGSVCTCCVVRCNQLYVTFGGFTDAAGSPTLNPDRFGLLWYQLDLTGDSNGCGKGVENPTTVPATIQASLLYDNALTNPKSYYVGSIAANKLGDVVITGTESGLTTFPNVFYVARKKTDPLNTLRNPVLVTNNNTFTFNFGPLNAVDGQRWGDYSSIFVDPLNDVNFWLSGMYAGVQNGWSIQATELIRTNK